MSPAQRERCRWTVYYQNMRFEGDTQSHTSVFTKQRHIETSQCAKHSDRVACRCESKTRARSSVRVLRGHRPLSCQ